MKALKWLLALLIVSLAAGAASAQTTYQVALTWVNDSTPACPATSPKSCTIGKTLTNVTVSGSPVVVAGPTTITPTMTSYTTPAITYTAPITQLYTLVTNYYDASGKAQVTGNGTCGSTNTPGPCSVDVFIVLPPTNVTVTPVNVSEVIEPENPVGMM